MTASFRIVVIDDDPDLRKLVQATLQFMAGWEVATAASGGEGIDVVQRFRPDAVAVDLMMPDMDGFEVCRRLKADPATAAIPIVLLTGRQTDGAQANAVGAVGVIDKPFDIERLAEQILALCRLDPHA